MLAELLYLFELFHLFLPKEVVIEDIEVTGT